MVLSSPSPSAERGLTAEERSALEAFIAEDKFVADGILYAGIEPPEARPAAVAAINAIAHQLLKAGRFSEEGFFDTALAALQLFNLADTDDRERAATYVEQLMDILGIESSEGRLNSWMYLSEPTGPDWPPK